MLNKHNVQDVINSQLRFVSHAPLQCICWEKHSSGPRKDTQAATDNPFALGEHNSMVTSPHKAKSYFRNSYPEELQPLCRMTSSALLLLGMVLGGLQASVGFPLLLQVPPGTGCREGDGKGVSKGFIEQASSTGSCSLSLFSRWCTFLRILGRPLHPELGFSRSGPSCSLYFRPLAMASSAPPNPVTAASFP